MTKDVLKKEQKLVDILKGTPSCLVAFSGGLDSTYLCAMAKNHVPGRVVAITIVDAAMPESDLEAAKEFASRNNIEHRIIKEEMDAKVRQNPKDRCYHCKNLLFQKLDAIKAQENLYVVMDGENKSDSEDNRPGTMAAREWNVASPLAKVRLDKAEIRHLAKKMGLEIWARPQSACLSSRIPIGTTIEDGVLRKIDLTESLIRSRGIRMIRARMEGTGTRLELGQDENTQENQELLRALKNEIMALGWDNVAVDPTGYIPSGLRSRKNDK